MESWSATIAWQQWLRRAETSPAGFVSRSSGRNRPLNNALESFRHATCILRDLHSTMAIQQGSGQERRQRMLGVPHEIQLHHSEQILDRRKRGKGTARQQLPSSTGQETLQIFWRRKRRMPVRKKLLLLAHASRSDRFHRLHPILDELHPGQPTQLEWRNTRRLFPALCRPWWLQTFRINSRTWNIPELCIKTLGLHTMSPFYDCLYFTCNLPYLHIWTCDLETCQSRQLKQVAHFIGVNHSPELGINFGLFNFRLFGIFHS